MAALSAWHESHDAAAEALEAVRVLPAHAMLETYSVLTRLPGGLAVPPPPRRTCSPAASMLPRCALLIPSGS